MRQKTVWIAAALLLGSVSFTAAEPQPALHQALQNADQLLGAKKLKEAEAELHRAEALTGGPCGECLIRLASVRAVEGKWRETVDMIQRALPLLTEPASLARAYNQLGVAYVKGAGGS